MGLRIRVIPEQSRYDRELLGPKDARNNSMCSKETSQSKEHLFSCKVMLLLTHPLEARDMEVSLERSRNKQEQASNYAHIPGLLGLLIDLIMIIIPSRVPVDETPIYFIYGPFCCFATKAWRVKFKRIRDVIGSIVNTLLTTLCIPYLLLKSLFPLLGYPQSVNPAIERFIWPVLSALTGIWFMAKQTYDLVIYLHRLVFNDRYVVGERVDDLTEDQEQGLIHRV